MKKIIRRSDIQKRKTFGGKIFVLYNIYADKKTSNVSKRRLQRTGHMVRIIKFSMSRHGKALLEYGVYSRKK